MPGFLGILMMESLQIFELFKFLNCSNFEWCPKYGLFVQYSDNYYSQRIIQKPVWYSDERYNHLNTGPDFRSRSKYQTGRWQ